MTECSKESTEEASEASYWKQVDEVHARLAEEMLEWHERDQYLTERKSLNSCVVCNAAFHVFDEEANENMVCGSDCLDEYHADPGSFSGAIGERRE